MKLLILLLIPVLISCTDKGPVTQNDSLEGTWRLIEIYNGDGGSNSSWTPVENGYTYTFMKNGNFTSNRFEACTKGSYSISSNKLILVYGCNGFSTGVETPEGTFIENYDIKDGFLILSPTYLNCDEGCENKFEKSK